MSPLGWKVSNILQGKSGDLLITPERMKRLGGSGSDAQLWMCQGMKIKSDAAKQYCIGTWNIRSMNQGKLDTVKQEMVRININTLRIRELKWTGMGKFNLEDHYIYYCRQETLRRNGVALSQQNSPKCSTWLQYQK